MHPCFRVQTECSLFMRLCRLAPRTCCTAPARAAIHSFIPAAHESPYLQCVPLLACAVLRCVLGCPDPTRPDAQESRPGSGLGCTDHRSGPPTAYVWDSNIPTKHLVRSEAPPYSSNSRRSHARTLLRGDQEHTWPPQNCSCCCWDWLYIQIAACWRPLARPTLARQGGCVRWARLLCPPALPEHAQEAGAPACPSGACGSCAAWCCATASTAAAAAARARRWGSSVRGGHCPPRRGRTPRALPSPPSRAPTRSSRSPQSRQTACTRRPWRSTPTDASAPWRSGMRTWRVRGGQTAGGRSEGGARRLGGSACGLCVAHPALVHSCSALLDGARAAAAVARVCACVCVCVCVCVLMSQCRDGCLYARVAGVPASCD